MAIGCGAKCSKIMLIVFNIIFWLSGCAILAVGIWLRVDPNMVSLQQFISLDPQDTTLETAAYVLIGVGAFIFLVGFCGCCGALRESKFMLGVYIACLVIVMAAELAAGIIVAIFKNQIEEKLKSTLTTNLKQKYNSSKLITDGWDFVQLSFECCGYDNYTNYRGSFFNMNTTQPVPETCCKLKSNTDISERDYVDKNKCITEATNRTPGAALNDKGCYPKVLEWINNNLPIVIGVGVGIACLELFGFVFAVCLCRGVDKDD